MSRYVPYTEEVRDLRNGDWIDDTALKALVDAQYQQHPTYAVCTLSTTRFFFVVWPAGDPWLMNGGEVLASGYAATREDAEQQARDIAGVPDSLPPLPRYERFGPHRTFHPIRQGTIDLYHRRLHSGAAAHYHRQLAVQKRMRTTTQTQESAPLEFVYTFHRSDYDNTVSTEAHRIVKKTKTRLYIERDSRPWRYEALAESPDNWWLHDVKTFVIDRATIEREGKAHAVTWHWYDPTYYLSPEPPQEEQRTPACLAVLGLHLPCTATDVKRAFRKLSKEAHPDRGGAASRFIALTKAYTDALAHVQP